MRYYSLGRVLGKSVAVGNPTWIVTLPWWYEEKYSFYHDAIIDDWYPKTFGFTTDGTALDFYQESEYVHLLSPQFQAVLTRHCSMDDFQFLPLRLRSSRGENIRDGYALCNYRKWCKAIDTKRSRLFPNEQRFVKHPPEGMYYLEHVALNRNKIGDAKVFRVVGCPSLFAYREDVVGALQSAGLSGLMFEEIEV